MRASLTAVIALGALGALVTLAPRAALADKPSRCAALEDAQRDTPDPDTQWKLAACYAETGKLASAWNLYTELGRTATPERRKQASERATKLAPRVPKLLLKFQPRPDGIRVFMNTTDAVAFIDVQTPIDPGTYKLAASAPGFDTWRKTIEVKAGKDDGKVVTVVAKLARATATTQPVEPDDPEPEPEPEPADVGPTAGLTRSSTVWKPLVDRVSLAADLGFLFGPQAYRGMARLAYGRGELFEVGLAAGVRGGNLAVEYGAGVDLRGYIPFGSFCRPYAHAGVGYWTTTGLSTNVGGGLACQDWRSGAGPQLYVEFNKEFGGTGGGVLVGFGRLVVGTHE